jgi:lysozyme family protein
MRFEDAVSIVMAIEGGYSNNPNDRGGETKFGISKRAYPDLDIKNLTRDQAISIYRRDYWDHCKLDLMPGILRLSIFDSAVNQGAHFAISAIQRVAGLPVDGVCGPQTVQALSTHPDPKTVLADFLHERIDAYYRSPDWKVFWQGWTLRLLEIAIRSE